MWTFDSIVDLTQNPRSQRWYARFLVTNGSEQRCESLKFVARPTLQNVRDGITAFLQARNADEALAAKRQSPPSLAGTISADSRATLAAAADVLRQLATSVNADVRDDYLDFVATLKQQLARWGLAGE